MSTISYDYANKAIRFGEFIAPILSSYNGEKFNGFTSKTLYTSFELSGVTGASEIRLYKISSNPFSSDTQDYCSPDIEISGTNNVNYDINNEVTIYSAIAVDLMDIYSTITVTVRDTNDKPMTSVDGVILNGVACDKNYIIKLSEYGRYSVVYNYEDCTNNTDKFSCFLNVIDSVAPVITAPGGMKIDAKLGDTYTIPVASVTDNIDKEVKLYTLVTYPNGKISTLPTDKNAKFTH